MAIRTRCFESDVGLGPAAREKVICAKMRVRCFGLRSERGRGGTVIAFGDDEVVVRWYAFGGMYTTTEFRVVKRSKFWHYFEEVRD